LNFNRAFVVLAVAVSIAIDGASARAGAPIRVVPLVAPEAPPMRVTSLGVPPPAPDLSAFDGKPVRDVNVVLSNDPWGDLPPPKLHIVTPGEPFSPALARVALREALATGSIADARVEVSPDGDGVRIRVHAVPRRIIDGLRVDVHRAPIDREEILHEAELEEGGEILGDEIDVRKRRIVALLARRGFPEAQVDITMRETDTPTRILLILDVNPGLPRDVGRRVFYVFGAKAEDLARYTKPYEVDRGDRVDESALVQADLALGNRLRAGGYYEAAVKHDVVLATYANHESVVTLRVRVDSGPHYSTRFDGNEHYDEDALRDALGLDTDPDTGEQHLADKLRRFYVARGFLDVQVTSELRGKPTSPTRYVVFHVREGRRVSVASRQYPCVRDSDISNLTGGGPRSASAIGRELDSFLDEDLPGADFLSDPDPRVVDRDLGGGTGTRVVPIDLDPNATFSPDTYDKGAAHVQELYRNEGYLSALVGPVQVLRRRCDPRSPPGRCVPIPFKQNLPDVCTYDRSGLPLPVSQLDTSFTCQPDPAHGVECEPHVRLRIPIKLGPRTTLHDVAFFGAKSLSEATLAKAADLELGKPVSALQIDEARRRIAERYKEDGFYYVEVKYTIERSLDNTHARARFDITEGEQVIVRQIIVQGNANTRESVIRRRVALEVGQPYRASDVRKTQERIATLNVFTSVSVVLQDAQVPQRDKTVIITVAEKPMQYIEPALGFSSGEGARASLEYGYTNLFGSAISAIVRGRISYLPDFLITDQTILANFQELEREHGVGSRIALRGTLSLGFPDIGLGPDVRGAADVVGLQDVERYFVIDKFALLPTLYWRPTHQQSFSLSASFEYNNLDVFNNQTPAEAAALSGGNLDVVRLLRAPAGQSLVFSQRLLWSWDRRDTSFDAHTGTYFSASVEHVNWTPQGVPPNESQCTTCLVLPPPGGPSILPQAMAPSPGHFLKLAGTFSGYFPLPFYKKIIVAATLRIGGIIQLANGSTTYPDRFFFMGGSDSIRSFQQDSMLPQDAADQILANNINASQVAIRGGNLLINPRVELRIPVSGPFETVLFFDTGNLWQDAAYPFDHGFTWRAAVGTGIRVQTPIAPIALDYGINLTRYSAFEDFGALNFAIGLF
jgi:outer membrane protein insertion porin family